MEILALRHHHQTAHDHILRKMNDRVERLINVMSSGNVIRVNSSRSSGDLFRAITGNNNVPDREVSRAVARSAASHRRPSRPPAISATPAHSSIPTTPAAEPKDVPVLLGQYTPSASDIHNLTKISLKDLKTQPHHGGKVIYLNVRASTEQSSGFHVYTAKDSVGAQGELWCLVTPPDGQELRKDTIIAVREPFFTPSPSGKAMICAHHINDIISISRSDQTVKELFPNLFRKGRVNYLQAGNTATTSGSLSDALDLYTSGIDELVGHGEVNAEEVDKLKGLLIKRGQLHLRLGAHGRAYEDACKFLGYNSKHVQALKLAHTSAYESSRFQLALEHAESLQGLDVESPSYQRLVDRTRHRVIEELSGGYNLEALARSVNQKKHTVDAATFVGPIEARDSRLGGRGMFALQDVKAGDLLLSEKPFEIAHDSDATPSKDGLVVQGQTVHGTKLALLRKVANKLLGLPESRGLFFTLTDGLSKRGTSDALDSYRILSIIKLNAFGTFAGKSSDCHCVYDPATAYATSSATVKRAEQGCGLWLKASMFNHSCVPNVFWTWIGDLFVIRAMRDISAGQELTLSYALGAEGTDKITNMLRTDYGFKCTCALCKADGTLRGATKAQRDMGKTAHLLPNFVKYGYKEVGSTQEKAVLSFEDFVRRSIATYDAETYKDIPYLSLARPLLHLGHAYIGDLAGWTTAKPQVKAKAEACFTACLQLGLCIDPSAAEHELLIAQNGQVQITGISALMGLAELAYLNDSETGNDHVSDLLGYAKQLYKICHGEDVTFYEQHKAYVCAASAPADIDVKPIKTVASIPRPVPDFLVFDENVHGTLAAGLVTAQHIETANDAIAHYRATHQ